VLKTTQGIQDTNEHTGFTFDRTVGLSSVRGTNIPFDDTDGWSYMDGGGISSLAFTDGYAIDDGGGESIAPIPLNV